MKKIALFFFGFIAAIVILALGVSLILSPPGAGKKLAENLEIPHRAVLTY